MNYASWLPEVPGFPETTDQLKAVHLGPRATQYGDHFLAEDQSSLFLDKQTGMNATLGARSFPGQKAGPSPATPNTSFPAESRNVAACPADGAAAEFSGGVYAFQESEKKKQEGDF
jgi:hypothetical protein